MTYSTYVTYFAYVTYVTYHSFVTYSAYVTYKFVSLPPGVVASCGRREERDFNRCQDI